MRRFSIRTLMAFVVVSAVGLAALRNASEFWAVAALLADLVAIGIAVLGAAFLRGREQAWWAGFALFSCGYLAFLMGLWFDSTFHSQEVTNPALQYAYEHIHPDASRQATLITGTPFRAPYTPSFDEF